MSLPALLETLWSDLEAVRSHVLKEADGLSQGQADWRPADTDWSAGEILHHLTLAEINTGKLTSKLLKEVSAGKPFPADLQAFPPLPVRAGGPGEAPEGVRADRGLAIERLLADMRAARDRTRQTLERLATVDPRGFTWSHPAFGVLDLSQWWQLQAYHDRDHLQQLRAVKAAPGFPVR